jgi:hypothetical protein
MTARTIRKERIRLFTEIFKDLSVNGENEVYKQILIDELVSTGKFWESDALNSISYALKNWEIIEHKPDWYSKRDSKWTY